MRYNYITYNPITSCDCQSAVERLGEFAWRVRDAQTDGGRNHKAASQLEEEQSSLQVGRHPRVQPGFAVVHVLHTQDHLTPFLPSQLLHQHEPFPHLDGEGLRRFAVAGVPGWDFGDAPVVRDESRQGVALLVLQDEDSDHPLPQDQPLGLFLDCVPLLLAEGLEFPEAESRRQEEQNCRERVISS